MCRLAAYAGPPLDAHAFVYAPSHSLVVQSYAPRMMDGALLNADGFGLAWYSAAAPTPALYRTVLPLWGDDNLPSMAPHLRSTCFLANARSATPGFGIQSTNVSPFVSGPLAFTHNGFLRRFGEVFQRRLRDPLSDARYAGIQGSTDSEHLFAATLQRLDGGASLADAASAVVLEVSGWARDADVVALLNVILTDGRELVATRCGVGHEAPTLYRRSGPDGALWLASEPFDEEGWEPLAAGTLLHRASTGEVTLRRLEGA
jgi:ergothioneine biosynthesis protein EgtC